MVRVVDGDTVVLTGVGKTRLIGVDTPEVFGGAECFGPEASRFAKRVLRPGRRVGVTVGVEPRDRYGRTLAYVFLSEGPDLQRGPRGRRLRPAAHHPPQRRPARRSSTQAARSARAARRGLWATC